MACVALPSPQRRSRGSLALLVAVLGTLVAATEAMGAYEATVRHAPEAGPVLFADGTAWVERDADLRSLTLRRTGRFATSSRIASTDSNRLEASLDGSDTQVALEVDNLQRRTGEIASQVLRSAGSDTLTPLSPVCPKDRADRFRSVDTAADAIAFRGPGCGQATVRGRDGDERRLPDGAYGVRVAGDFVAWIDGVELLATSSSRSMVIARRSDGTEVFRSPAGALPGRVFDVDLQEDGRLAVLYKDESGDRLSARVAIATPGQAGFTVLPQSFVVGRVLIKGGRVVGVVRNRRKQRIGIVDLARSAEVEVSPFIVGDDMSDAFDYDGSRLAVAEERCAGVRILVVEALQAQPRSPKSCKLELDRAPVLTRRGIRVDVGCVGRGIDCSFRVSAYRSGRRIAAAQSDVGGVLTLRLARRDRARLKRGDTVRIATGRQIRRQVDARLR